MKTSKKRFPSGKLDPADLFDARRRYNGHNVPVLQMDADGIEFARVTGATKGAILLTARAGVGARRCDLILTLPESALADIEARARSLAVQRAIGDIPCQTA
jgi:hypothetical protein